MQTPPMPPDEAARLAALRGLHLLDSAPEARFDRITRTACRLFGVPTALVSLVDQDRQWFKSRQGLEATETPRDISFCGHTILAEETLVVPDALGDPRFVDNPLVTGPPHIRFYAGQPLLGPGGHRVGTLCLLDSVPHAFDDADRAALRELATWVDRELTFQALVPWMEGPGAVMAFVSTLSHELRTPMTAIKGALGLLAGGAGGELPEAARDLTLTALKHANRLVQLVNDLQDLEKAESGRMAFDLRDLRLLPLLTQALEGARASHGSTLFNLEPVDEALASARVRMDEGRLLQVLGLLLDHAAAASPRGAAIRVGLRLDEGRLGVTVAHVGFESATAFRETLFQRFAQTAAPGARPRGSVGLDLSLARTLGEQMGAVLGVDSEPGATVLHLTLPASAR